MAKLNTTNRNFLDSRFHFRLLNTKAHPKRQETNRASIPIVLISSVARTIETAKAHRLRVKA